MSEEVTNAVSQLKGLLNKYPNKTLEILQYVFGKDIILKIINKPTYEDLQQENKRLKEVIDEAREYINHEWFKRGQLGIIDKTFQEWQLKDILQILDKAGDVDEKKN